MASNSLFIAACAASLVVNGACSESPEGRLAPDDVAFERIILDDTQPVGQRAYRVARGFKRSEGSLGVHFCHLGVFDDTGGTFERVLLDLDFENAAPFEVGATTVYFEVNGGDFGFMCVEVARALRADLAACLASEDPSSCQAVRDAEARVQADAVVTAADFCRVERDGSGAFGCVSE